MERVSHHMRVHKDDQHIQIIPDAMEIIGSMKRRLIEKVECGDAPKLEAKTDLLPRIDELPMRHSIVVAMQKARVCPNLIYAFNKTGFVVSDETKDQLSTQELEEWNAALDEFENGKTNSLDFF